MDIGLNILLKRKDKKIKSKTLAEMVGVTQAYMSEIETGKKIPSIEVLQKIAKALGSTTSEILGESEHELKNSSDEVLAEWMDFKMKNMRGLNLLAKINKSGIDIKEVEDYVDFLISKKTMKNTLE